MGGGRIKVLRTAGQNLRETERASLRARRGLDARGRARLEVGGRTRENGNVQVDSSSVLDDETKLIYMSDGRGGLSLNG